MTQNIKNLTRKYLNSLNAGYLSEDQKRRIIEINSQSGWIIFNVESLQRNITNEEFYDITSPQLIELLKEQIKTYHANDWKNNFLTHEDDPNSININNIEIKFFYWIRGERIYSYQDKWIAVNKEGLGDGFGGTLNEINNVDLTLGVIHRKTAERLDDLLNSSEIRNSTPPQMKEESSSNQKPNSSSDNSTPQSVQFVVREVISLYDSLDYLYMQIKTDSPLEFNGSRATKITLNGERARQQFLNGNLAVGNTILIENARFSLEKDELSIGNDFTEIKVVSLGNNSSHNTNNSPPTPPSPPFKQGFSVSFVINKVEKRGSLSFNLTPDLPLTFYGKEVDKVDIRGNKIKELFQRGELEAGRTIVISKIQLGMKVSIVEGYQNRWLEIKDDSAVDLQIIPQFYPEVRQKNAELAQEENSFSHLITELTNIINKNNQEICPKASKLGLNLPTIPLEALKYFEENFFIELDDKLPLTDPANQKIIAKNEVTRKKKRESIKANIYKIYNKNLKKLKDYHNKRPSSSDLEELKNQAIETINKVLTDKDNLQNIDLLTLESGKYLEWEEDLKKLKEKNEVTTYLENFLEVLRKFVTREREEDSKNRPNSNEKIEISEIDNAPSLAEARNIAKKLIRKLFNKYNVRAEDVEIIWTGKRSNSWGEHLEKLNSFEEIKNFVHRFEEKAMQKTNLLNSKSSPPHPLTWLIVPISIFVIGLAIIVGIIYQNRKVKRI